MSEPTDIVERLQTQPDELAREAANEILDLRRRLYACHRYFDHSGRITLPAGATCASGEMAVRMALKEEAKDAVKTCKAIMTAIGSGGDIVPRKRPPAF